MSTHTQKSPSCAAKPRRRWASGFTIVSTAVSVAVAGIMLAGGWMSYASMLRQWKIGNAEREMDQYAAAAMQELTNDLSWSWGGIQIEGGPRNTRWKFMFDDQFEENGQMGNSRFGRMRDYNKFVTFSYNPNSGILIGGRVPPWAGDNRHSQYRFIGTAPHRGEVRSFDRRDRMTVEGLTMEFNRFPWYRTNTIEDQIRRQGVVEISMTMQYTYRGTFPNSDMGLYGNYYVRERQYSTQVSLKNWDTDGNAFKDSLLAHTG
ncbi:MAG TPA: hypothetical protein VGL38_04680 [bacterium]|jgi:hypothetical protein